MKQFIFVCSMVSLISISSFAAETYQCKGVKGSKGSVQLTVDTTGQAVVGSYVDQDSQKEVTVSCSGNKSRNVQNYTYLALDGSGCPADYTRIPTGLNNGAGGLIALVARSGGDTHDSSGYTYQYFYCSK